MRPSFFVAFIGLLGDSFGAGSGTDQAKTWAALLETRHGHSFYNLSIPDQSPWQELMNLKIEIGRIERSEHTVVLWAIFSGNDLDDVFEGAMEPVLTDSLIAQWRVSAASFRNRSPVRQVCQRAFLVLGAQHHPPMLRTLPSGRAILFRQDYADRTGRDVSDIRAHPNLPRFVRAFGEMKRFAARERLRVAVAVLSSKEEVYGWVMPGFAFTDAEGKPSAFSVTVRHLCEANGFAFTDLKPPMALEADRLLLEKDELLWCPTTRTGTKPDNRSRRPLLTASCWHRPRLPG